MEKIRNNGPSNFFMLFENLIYPVCLCAYVRECASLCALWVNMRTINESHIVFIVLFSLLYSSKLEELKVKIIVITRSAGVRNDPTVLLKNKLLN